MKASEENKIDKKQTWRQSLLYFLFFRVLILLSCYHRILDRKPYMPFFMSQIKETTVSAPLVCSP